MPSVVEDRIMTEKEIAALLYLFGWIAVGFMCLLWYDWRLLVILFVVGCLIEN